MDRDVTVYNNIWKESHKYMDLSEDVLKLSEIIKNHSHILDLCAGGGRNTIPMLMNGHYVTAVDRNKFAILSLNKIKKKHENLIVIKADALDFLEKDNRKYDLIIVFDCIHHLVSSIDELKKCLEVIINKINLNGFLLVTFLADISYPGGNENVKRIYLSYDEAEAVIDDVLALKFDIINKHKELVIFDNAQNIVNGKLISGKYSATRLVVLCEKRK